MNVKKSLIFVGIALILVATPALAVGSTSGDTAATKQSLIQQKQQLIAAQKEKMAAAKCAVVENRIQTRITNFNAGKVKRLNSFNNMKDRLTTLEAKLETKGYDTTKLKADLPVLSGKIDKFSADYATYIAALSETQNYACGKSEGEFRAQLLESRDLLTTVAADSKDIRDYWTNTIKPDLQAIKTQTPTVSGSGSTAE